VVVTKLLSTSASIQSSIKLPANTTVADANAAKPNDVVIGQILYPYEQTDSILPAYKLIILEIKYIYSAELHALASSSLQSSKPQPTKFLKDCTKLAVIQSQCLSFYQARSK
jgi:hypothetical protein